METKLIGLLFLLGVISHAVLFIIPLKGKEFNIPSSIYTILSFAVSAALYYICLPKHRVLVAIVSVLFLAFAILNFVSIQQLENNSYTKTGEAIILIGFSLLYFYRLLIDLPVQHLQRMPMFWYNAAFLLYSAATLFIFVFTSYLVEVLHSDLLIYWTFHNILNIIQHFVVMLGLWQELRNFKLR